MSSWRVQIGQGVSFVGGAWLGESLVLSGGSTSLAPTKDGPAVTKSSVRPLSVGRTVAMLLTLWVSINERLGAKGNDLGARSYLHLR
jgi:hypothetical protein